MSINKFSLISQKWINFPSPPATANVNFCHPCTNYKEFRDNLEQNRKFGLAWGLYMICVGKAIACCSMFINLKIVIQNFQFSTRRQRPAGKQSWISRKFSRRDLIKSPPPTPTLQQITWIFEWDSRIFWEKQNWKILSRVWFDKFPSLKCKQLADTCKDVNSKHVTLSL